MTEDLFRFGQQVLAAQPFSGWLGAQLTAYTAGHAEIRFTLKPDYTQHVGSPMEGSWVTLLILPRLCRRLGAGSRFRSHDLHLRVHNQLRESSARRAAHCTGFRHCHQRTASGLPVRCLVREQRSGAIMRGSARNHRHGADGEPDRLACTVSSE